MSSSVSDSQVALVGLGVENRALAGWLAHHGNRFSVCDADPQCQDRIRSDPGAAAWVSAVDHWQLGEQYLQGLGAFDVLYRSPGVWARHPRLMDAQQSGSLISSQTQLFLDLCPVLVIGITGTKGKGTTATMLATILTRAEMPHRLAGNIGIPPISFLDELDSQEVIVLELSSFQLQDLTRSPQGAIVLPIDTDHLDVHADRYEYVEAKRSISRFQTASDWVVVAAESETAVNVTGSSKARRLLAGGSAPTKDEGTWVYDDQILCRIDGQERVVAPVEALSMRGRHNLGNACAASAAAILLGAKTEQIEAGLRAFEPLPHRLEEVDTVGGVLFVNDSLGTTPESSAAAIDTYADRPLVAIVGGSSKGAQYDVLGDALARRATALVLLGDEGPRIAESAHRSGFQGAVAQAIGMEIAVEVARRLTPEGGVVLLAPACASFGMFRDYAQRGEAFRQAVKQLPR